MKISIVIGLNLLDFHLRYLDNPQIKFLQIDFTHDLARKSLMRLNFMIFYVILSNNVAKFILISPQFFNLMIEIHDLYVESMNLILSLPV